MPHYANGTKVFDSLAQRYGKVVRSWDSPGEGRRYAIQHSGHEWGVPAWAVFATKRDWDRHRKKSSETP